MSKRKILIVLMVMVICVAFIFYLRQPNMKAEAKPTFVAEFSDFGAIDLPAQERAYYGMLGDVDGDGRPDIVLVGTGRVIILKNNIPKK